MWGGNTGREIGGERSKELRTKREKIEYLGNPWFRCGQMI